MLRLEQYLSSSFKGGVRLIFCWNSFLYQSFITSVSDTYILQDWTEHMNSLKRFHLYIFPLISFITYWWFRSVLLNFHVLGNSLLLGVGWRNFSIYRRVYCPIDSVLCSFLRSRLSIVLLRAWAIAVLFRKLSPMTMHSKLFPTFSFTRFSVSSFTLRTLIHLNLSFVQGGSKQRILNRVISNGWAHSTSLVIRKM